jgi:hypothetical protein
MVCNCDSTRFCQNPAVFHVELSNHGGHDNNLDCSRLQQSAKVRDIRHHQMSSREHISQKLCHCCTRDCSIILRNPRVSTTSLNPKSTQATLNKSQTVCISRARHVPIRLDTAAPDSPLPTLTRLGINLCLPLHSQLLSHVAATPSTVPPARFTSGEPRRNRRAWQPWEGLYKPLCSSLPFLFSSPPL